MNDILLHREKLSKAFINKHTNINYDSEEDWDTNCHITRDLLIHLLECVSSDKNKSNFQTIYFEYKGVGHSCCIYENKILQSFEKYHYINSTVLPVPVDELYEAIENYLNLFFPNNFINLNEEIKLYTRIKYYQTNVSEEQVIKNLSKLLDLV